MTKNKINIYLNENNIDIRIIPLFREPLITKKLSLETKYGRILPKKKHLKFKLFSMLTKLKEYNENLSNYSTELKKYLNSKTFNIFEYFNDPLFTVNVFYKQNYIDVKNLKH